MVYICYFFILFVSESIALGSFDLSLSVPVSLDSSYNVLFSGAWQYNWWIFVTFVCLGLISGVAAGFFGIGGGTIIVPCVLLLGFSIQQAIGISIAQMIFSSIFGSIVNYKKGLLDVRDGIFIGLGGLLGASCSGLVLSMLGEVLLSAAFLSLTLISFYRFAFKIKPTLGTSPLRSTLQKSLLLTGAGAFTGVFAISLGIGGGLLIAPILGYYLGYDSKKVVPLSLFFVVFSSVSGTLSLYHHQVLDLHLMSVSFIVGLASIVGVACGIYLITKASAKTHRIALLWIYAFAIVITTYKLFEMVLA